MRGRIRRRLAPILVVLSGLVIAGCGIPLSNAAQRLPRSPAPLGLFTTPTTTTTTTVPGTPNAVPIPVYFLNADATRLVMTTADAPGQPSASIALELLTLGPTVADSKHHFRTALSTSPQATPAVRVDPRSGLATVALDNTTEALFGPPLYEALAQIVFTITDAGFGVHSVVFTYAGGRIYAYLPNLTYTERPVTRADFAELAPAASSTTPKATAASTSTTSSAPASP